MKDRLYKRINITLPQSTVTLLESVAEKGDRSMFIDSAIRTHIKELQKQEIREQIKDGSIANAETDITIATEWFEIEEEAWRN